MSIPTDVDGFVMALAALPECGASRLQLLLSTAPPHVVWQSVKDGRVLALPGVAVGLGTPGPRLASAWRVAAATLDPGALEAAAESGGVRVLCRGGHGYPSDLVDDIEAPAALFAMGGDVAARPRVAVVGTRRCTHYGREVARSFGRDLSAAGVSVVSGLALGIDGAAHEGALAAQGGAPPVGVVGSGLDVVYPRRHASLWRRVAERGVLLSEAPLGAPPEGWRFPLRNRIIAGLADILVVVESHAVGGSMLTVRAAIDRGVPVMAVPGSVRSAASAGTNRLLAEGVAPAVDVGDVLVALSLERPPPMSLDTQSQAEVEGDTRSILEAVDWSPTGTETILRRTGLPVSTVAVGLARLEATGLVSGTAGWWQRCGESC